MLKIKTFCQARLLTGRLLPLASLNLASVTTFYAMPLDLSKHFFDEGVVATFYYHFLYHFLVDIDGRFNILNNQIIDRNVLKSVITSKYISSRLRVLFCFSTFSTTFPSLVVVYLIKSELHYFNCRLTNPDEETVAVYLKYTNTK